MAEAPSVSTSMRSMAESGMPWVLANVAVPPAPMP